jgi:ubiquinone/menaquinone biosynthesis C-methylase UbiE
MNRTHSALTDWGLAQVTIGPNDRILDVGCGGGRTIAKLLDRAPGGRVEGIDHSALAVEASRRANRRAVEQGRAEVAQGSVSALPYADGAFDLVTAVETHFWWPKPADDMREVWRVLKPGGQVLVIAEFYDGGRHASYARRLSELTAIAALTPAEHRELLAGAGFESIRIQEDPRRGWICVIGQKPGRSDVDRSTQ